jgi:DNA-binding beta-propeller fold protein YncE
MSDRFDFLELDSSRPRRLPRHQPSSEDRSPKTESQPPRWKVAELIGGPGAGVGEFSAPGGLALDVAGNLYVADSYNHRVQRITPAGDVALIGRRGTGPGEFLNPQAVASDGGLGFYVLEQGGCRIQWFGANGEWHGAFGSPGSGPGQLKAPMAMARGPCGSLFVADTGNNRIVRWTTDGFWIMGTGFWSLNGSNTRCSAPLAKPQGLTVDAAGRIWVAETLRHRVLVFDARFRPLASLGSTGEAPGQFREPQDLAVTPDGCLMVADTGNDRVQVLNAQGAVLHTLNRIENAGAAVSSFNAPSGLALRSGDEAYVADTGNHRVLRLVRREA